MRFWRKKKGKKEHGKLANWLSTSLWWVEADNVVCLTSHFFKKHLGTSHLKPRMAAAPDPRQTDLHAFRAPERRRWLEHSKKEKSIRIRMIPFESPGHQKGTAVA